MTSDSSIARRPEPAPDGQGDFDWELGTWHTSVRVLNDPLADTRRPAAADRWSEFEGTSVVRPLLDGRANVVELRVSGPAGEISGLNLRLYEPAEQLWSATFASLRDGMLTPSVRGRFLDGVGEFHGDDVLADRPIRVRFVIERQGPDRATFTQSFSDDDGTTWETNWVAVDERADR